MSPWQVFMEYWELTLLLATWAVLGALALRRRREWRQRRFSEHVNVSLNLVDETEAGAPRLVFRTLLEGAATRVWLNEWGVRLVQRAANRTTRERPFLAFERQEDRDQVQRGMVNALAQRFAEGALARGLGLPVRTESFLFGLTWERYGQIHTHKLRAMLAHPRTLERLFEGGLAERVSFESEAHRVRLDTLREMHRLWRSEDATERAALGAVELAARV